MKKGVRALQSDVQGRMRVAFWGFCLVAQPGQVRQGFHRMWLVLSLVALEMGFRKDGKAPDPFLAPSPPPNTHTHTSCPLWNNILVRQQDRGAQGGMLSRRTGAPHLRALQRVREMFVPFPPPTTVDPTAIG